MKQEKTRQILIFDDAIAHRLWTSLERYRLLPVHDGTAAIVVFPPGVVPEHRIRCRLAVVPGDWNARVPLEAEEIVTYGFSSRDTVTLSSSAGPLLCLQREIVTLDGYRLEPQELKFEDFFPVSAKSLCAAAAALSAGVPVDVVASLRLEF